MFNVVLVHPSIPPNTGNVIRLVANTGCALHLIEPLGFSMDDRLLRRAGLDYHEYAAVRCHASWHQFLNDALPDRARMFAFTTQGTRPFADVAWRAGDWLVYGCETQGLPEDIRETFGAPQRVRLPMRAGQRSLNLSNAVAVGVFEAWRQCGYAGAAQGLSAPYIATASGTPPHILAAARAIRVTRMVARRERGTASHLGPRATPHQLLQHLRGRVAAFEHRHPGLGDRHLYLLRPGAPQHHRGAVNAFGNMAQFEQNSCQRQALRQQQPDFAVARQLAGGRQHKIAQTAEAHEGLGASPQ